MAAADKRVRHLRRGGADGVVRRRLGFADGCASRMRRIERDRVSTRLMMRFIIATASSGYWPEAVSADSITASAPS